MEKSTYVCDCCKVEKEVAKCEVCPFFFCKECMEEERHIGIFSCYSCHSEKCMTYKGYGDDPDICYMCGISAVCAEIKTFSMDYHQKMETLEETVLDCLS